MAAPFVVPDLKQELDRIDRMDLTPEVTQSLNHKTRAFIKGLQTINGWLQAFQKRRPALAQFCQNADPLEIKTDPWERLQQTALELDHRDRKDILGTAHIIAQRLDQRQPGKHVESLVECLAVGNFDRGSDPRRMLLDRAQGLDNADQGRRKLALRRIFSHVGQRRKKLIRLRDDWQGQGQLALFNVTEILQIRDRLLALKTMCTDLAQATVEVEPQLIQQQAQIELLLTQVEEALGWRIHASSVASHLACDDHWYALMSDLRNRLFGMDKPEDLQSIADLLAQGMQPQSFQFDFALFVFVRRLIHDSENARAQAKFSNSKWVKDDPSNVISLKLIDGFLIPNSVLDLIPESPGFLPGSQQRFWYFRTWPDLTGLNRVFRDRLVGGQYHDVATLINEGQRQVVQFGHDTETARMIGRSVDLTKMRDTYAFRAALELPALMDNELARARQSQPSRWVSLLLQVLPFFNRSTSTRFFNIWIKQLEAAKTQFDKHCQSLAAQLLEDFERALLDGIDNRIFKNPTLLKTVGEFFKTYGNNHHYYKFLTLIKPLYMLKKFNFLQPVMATTTYRAIDEGRVLAFCEFADKNWSLQEAQAAKLVVDLITRKQIPCDHSEDQVLFEKIGCLLPADPQARTQAFAQLMHSAAKYIYLTGDDAKHTSYQFLVRHAPNFALSWSNARGYPRHTTVVEHRWTQNAYTAALAAPFFVGQENNGANRDFSEPALQVKSAMTVQWSQARQSALKGLVGNYLKVSGAGGENRTHTLLPIPDFESGASTSSATPASRRWAV